MIVSKADFYDVVAHLKTKTRLGLDTETTGLRMYHGAEACSIILAEEEQAYYFNFYGEPAHDGSVAPEEFILPHRYTEDLQKELFDDKDKTWYIQRAANFDLPILSRWGLHLVGSVHCTLTIGRVVRNDNMGYSLAEQLKEIGRAKDSTVEEYVTKHQLITMRQVPGKQTRDKDMHYHKVPFKVLAPYGESDGTNVIALGLHHEAKVKETDENILNVNLTETNRGMQRVVDNEKRLVKTIFRMKDYGCQIDVPYCEKAIKYEFDRAEKASQRFKQETGYDYKSSPKLFAEVFKDQKDVWTYTKKGNPSFDADQLARFKGPIADAILELRDAKSKGDFYQGFIYHADAQGTIHPNFNSEGTVHGRFSSSEPNFQNLTSEDDEATLEGEFVVRRAIIPRPGFILLMPDYSQMEYKFALDMACHLKGRLTAFGESINAGMDFHDATKELVKMVAHVDYPRRVFKISNFLTLYGGGVGKLAEALKIPMKEARIIRQAIKDAAPEIDAYIQHVTKEAELKKLVVNWFGRRCHFPVKHFAYKATNYLVSGGCADVVKLAMNRIDEYLLTKKSRMTMTIHDELVLECHESETNEVPKVVQDLMAQAYPSRYIPLNVDMEWSATSLADKTKGFP